ncbi:hypothetical protein DJ55_2309 [Yersinia pseudotuberculosis]|nr:hypothetical protein DJ55_2309 [Yersinia pseudotuberculosis]
MAFNASAFNTSAFNNFSHLIPQSSNTSVIASHAAC